MYRYTPKRRKWLKVMVIALVIAVLLVIGGVIGVRQYYNENLKAVSSDQTLVTVEIPEGSTLSEISTILKDKGLIRNKQIFEGYVRNNGASADIKAGTYELSPAYSVQEIVAILTEGKIASSLLTILPGMRLDQIKKTVHGCWLH